LNDRKQFIRLKNAAAAEGPLKFAYTSVDQLQFIARNFVAVGLND